MQLQRPIYSVKNKTFFFKKSSTLGGAVPFEGGGRRTSIGGNSATPQREAQSVIIPTFLEKQSWTFYKSRIAQILC